MSDEPRQPRAFPCPGFETENLFFAGNDGMFLRDYFAAKILQGIVICSYMEEKRDTRRSWENWDLKATKRAYELGDEMLKARSIKPQTKVEI